MACTGRVSSQHGFIKGPGRHDRTPALATGKKREDGTVSMTGRLGSACLSCVTQSSRRWLKELVLQYVTAGLGSACLLRSEAGPQGLANGV